MAKKTSKMVLNRQEISFKIEATFEIIVQGVAESKIWGILNGANLNH